jgi:acetolactate synthase-1/3 small subunit
VVTGDRQIVEQIEKQVAKLIDVKEVMQLTIQGSIQCELVLVKLQTVNGNRAAVIQLSEIFKAKIVDVAEDSITLQLTGNLDKVSSFLRLARPYGISELVRTGRASQAQPDPSPDDEN